MKLDPMPIKGELVRFPASDGLVLHGLLCKVPKSNTAVLHLHGIEGNFYRNPYMRITGNNFVNNGFSFFTIEQRGSYFTYKFPKKTGRTYKSIIAGGSIERFEDCIHDIQGAINYLKSIGIKKIYLQGHSTGCQKAIYYLYKKHDRSVKGLILLAPCDDYNIWKRELKPRFRQAVSFAKQISKRNPTFIMSQKYPKISLGAKRFLSVADPKNIESRLFDYDREKLAEFSKIRLPILTVFSTKEPFAVKPVSEYIKILKRDTNSVSFSHLFIKSDDHGFMGKEQILADGLVKWINSIS